MQLFLILIGSVLAIGAAYVGFNLWFMRRNPDWFLFPAITECSLCEKRVYVWQRRERRSWRIPVLGNPGACQASMSSVVHKGCHGHPSNTITRTVEFC